MTGSTSSTNSVASLQSGQWAEISNSQLTSALYNGPLASEIHGDTGPAGIMSAWSGATFDTTTDSLLVWGGGHHDYFGNEVYSFSLETMQWSRLTDPSPVPNGFAGGGILPDGTPESAHSYDGLAYVPGLNAMFLGSAGDVNGNSFPYTFMFNLNTHTWQRVADQPGPTVPGSVAAYDPASRHVFEVNNEVGLEEYNPATNTWMAHNGTPLLDDHMTGAIDPLDHLLVAVGNGQIEAFSLAGNSVGQVAIPKASGDLAAQNGASPGFVWDSAANEFVAWNGGSTLYTLDPHSWQWTAHTAAAGSATPTAPANNGTFGRFQYDPVHNEFIIVNAVDQDVFIEKPDFGASGGTTPPAPPPPAPPPVSGSGGGSGGTPPAPPPPANNGGGSSSSTPTPTDVGSGPDTLVVHISGDQDHGLPQFTLSVDGQQVGGVQAVAVQGTGVSHGSGTFEDITFHGNFADAHTVDINAVNIVGDQNLYLSSITLDGHTLLGNEAVKNTATDGVISDGNPNDAVLDITGTLEFNVAGLAGSGAPTPLPPTPAPPPANNGGGGSGGTPPAPGGHVLTVGSGSQFQFQTLHDAIAASHNGDVIQVQAGTYVNDFATITTDITIEGVGGMAHLVATDSPPNGKAILTTDANVTIDHLEFSGAQVSDGNGAGIRYETGNLTITNSFFHDNQEGILGGADPTGTITITNSEFAHNGAGDGQTHNLYVGDIAQLTIDNSYFHDAVVGHEIKSRAETTIVENSRIFDGPNGTASYSIDLPNGGKAVITNNVIEQGPNSENPAIIAYGEEGSVHANSSLQVTNNTILNDLTAHVPIGVNNTTSVNAAISGNKFFGLTQGEIASGPNTQSGNTFLTSEPALDTSSPIDGGTTAAPPPVPPPPIPSSPPPPVVNNGGGGSSGSGTDIGSGPDTLVVHISGDEDQGNPQFTLTVDGQQVGGVQTVNVPGPGVSHGTNPFEDFTFHGDFAGAHTAAINFVNEVGDRNLYLGSITLDGHTLLGNQATSNTATDGVISDVHPTDAVLDINGSLSFNVAGLAGSGSGTTPGAPPPPPSGSGGSGSGSGSGPSGTPPQGPEVVHEPHGHEMFVFKSFANAESEVATFNTKLDTLDVTQLLHAIGYKGHNPFADHTLTIAQNAQHQTELVLDNHGHDTVVVTLDHVLPHPLPHADIIWH